MATFDMVDGGGNNFPPIGTSTRSVFGNIAKGLPKGYGAGPEFEDLNTYIEGPNGGVWVRNSDILTYHPVITSGVNIPTTLVGWSGQTRQANIIVRKQWLQENAKKVGMNGYTCYADLGFKENEDGTFEAYVDDHNFSVEWVNKMATYHHVEKAKAELENRKIKYTETIEDGKPVITANLPFRKLNSGHQQTLGFSG